MLERPFLSPPPPELVKSASITAMVAASEETTLTVKVWRKLCAILKAWRSAGDIPGMLVVFIPRLTVSYMVVTVAQMARAIARLVGTSSSYEPKANLRILIVTDYMPPQTHGCAASPPPAKPAPPPLPRRRRSLAREREL